MISCQFKLRSHMCDWIAPFWIFLDNDGGFTIKIVWNEKNVLRSPKDAAKKWQVTIQGCEHRKMNSQRFTDFLTTCPFRDSERTIHANRKRRASSKKHLFFYCLLVYACVSFLSFLQHFWFHRLVESLENNNESAVALRAPLPCFS